MAGAFSHLTKRNYAMGSCFNTFLDQFELIIVLQGRFMRSPPPGELEIVRSASPLPTT